jgi:dTMP kinase
VTWGKFISIEGGEGAGKSTQARALASALAARGIDVVVTREPGGTEGAEAIRALLMTGEEDRWSAAAEALLFAAARADHVEKLIRPALERGQWVLCDRFIDSTRAYQGGAGGIADADILDLHRIGSGGLLPDRTLLLETESGIAEARAEARASLEPDRMGSKGLEYYQKVTDRFREIAGSDPARFRWVDASGTPETVTRRLLAALEDLV